MDGMIYTKHFQQRSQQRGMNAAVVTALLCYGERHKSRGGIESLIFTKHALADIKNDLGPCVFKMCEKVRNTYIIATEDGTLITVARSYRTTTH